MPRAALGFFFAGGRVVEERFQPELLMAGIVSQYRKVWMGNYQIQVCRVRSEKHVQILIHYTVRQYSVMFFREILMF